MYCETGYCSTPDTQWMRHCYQNYRCDSENCPRPRTSSHDNDKFCDFANTIDHNSCSIADMFDIMAPTNILSWRI